MPDNLLPRIPGEYIVDAMLTLPQPKLVEDSAIIDVFVEVPGIGRVRITARRLKSKRGRSTNYFWTAESAEAVV